MKPHDDRGTITVVLMALVLVTLLGAGLVVDGGRAMTARRHASNVAEAAARAGVLTANPVDPLDPIAARRAAIAMATGAGVPAVDVAVEVHGDRVKVTITERRTAVFLALTGQSVLTVRASGEARLVFTG
jgi:Flp pilus assembly protein TadG